MHKTLAALTITAALLVPGLAHARFASACAVQLPSVVDTRPESDLTIGTSRPQISARFSSATAVNPTSIRLTVDGIDVTNVATIANAYVSYVPLAPLSNGRHMAFVSGQAFDGTPFTDTWTFLVDSGVTASDFNPMWNYAPGPFGYPGFGFYPPGFSLFSPGPIFIVAGDFVEVIFFSPFSPFGTGFVTIGGIPGRFFLTPWFGCPGYYWATIPVPFGPLTRNAILSAHFTMQSGQTVIVHSTTPFQIDGTRRTLPSSVRYANEPTFLNHPASPQQWVKFVHVGPGSSASVATGPAGTIKPIAPIIMSGHPPAFSGGNQLPVTGVVPAVGIPVTSNVGRVPIDPWQATRQMNAHIRYAPENWNNSPFWSTVPSLPMTMPHPMQRPAWPTGAGQQH